jgi:hypothetical protein
MSNLIPCHAISIKPRERLLEVAAIWCERTGRSLGGLSAVVMNDGKSLDRLTDPSKAVLDTTLERFAAWFLQPDNWPDAEQGQARVPQEAREFAHVLGVSLQAAHLATGQSGDLSGEAAAC